MLTIPCAARFFSTTLSRIMLALLVLAVQSVTSMAAPTVLETVRARGYLNCGVAEQAPGLSQVNGLGQWKGLEIEFCSAVAAAVFGNKQAVKFRGIATGDRFKALEAGEIDILLRGTAWTLTRDAELGGRFVGVLFYDGSGFLVPKNHSIASVLELSGASICVLPGSSGERAVADFFGARGMRFQLVVSERWDQLVKTYSAGGCTVLTGDVSLLAFERSRLANSSNHMLLPEMVSKEPLGPAVKMGDEGWFSIVRWSYMTLIAADELGLTSSNVDEMRSSSLRDVRRLLGLEADLGAPLGLARDWSYQIIKQVGNYAEIFSRTLGDNSPLKLERGLNNVWTKGGLMYAVPLR